jgi:hypothetical protein
VTAAGVRPDFRAAARIRLILDLTGGSQNVPASSLTEGTVDLAPEGKEVNGRPGQLPLES